MPRRNSSLNSEWPTEDSWFPGLDARVTYVLLAACGVERKDFKGVHPATLWKWEKRGARARETSKQRVVKSLGLGREAWESAEGQVLRCEKERRPQDHFVAEPEANASYEFSPQVTVLLGEIIKLLEGLPDAVVQQLVARLEVGVVPKPGQAVRSKRQGRGQDPRAPGR